MKEHTTIQAMSCKTMTGQMPRLSISATTDTVHLLFVLEIHESCNEPGYRQHLFLYVQ